MEINEAERVVIAKPVASRPTCSNFRSFSELLAGAINGSPPNVCSETTVAAIRPKTVRFKPMINCAPAVSISSQADLSGTALCNSSDKVLKADCKPTVIYKPQAKLVSKATVSLLANMGNFNDNYQQQRLISVETPVQNPNQEQHNFSSHLHQNFPSQAQTDQTTELSRLSSQNQEDDLKSLSAAANVDRPSYDGYNWRKYGQKQVKGSEYPRSYYKCTHPNCPVKKKVERSLDGRIAEIVYKGEHNHSKPQPLKRNSSGTQGPGPVCDGNNQDTNNPLWNNSVNERNEGSEGRVENQNEIGLPAHSTYQTTAPHTHDPARNGSINAGAVTSDNSCGLSGECEEGSKGLEGGEDEPRSKRRKSDNQSNEAGISAEGRQEPHLVVQSSTETEIVGDGFRWRKYGQKVVKGNPYPRSYYRCTGLKCNVRKYVERVSDDPGAFITTYEGKHNHEMPLRGSNSAAQESNSQAPSGRSKP
ncbi:WRKY transcription factor 44 [Ricinus communis]|uniref:WRKY domain-containing protein n=1 Tax=Ricinus communis TaxID=3988 RepID=B9SGT1_RICCO|nr:WRKY transcription factor 44 [Ricinus communis]XP_025014224.1 WRKY transcription factor 44 [Ricinus communis]XP_048226131.1 WRKY transcription factor 44 [Ricinus communis]EEF37166.1 conserved hypothetical protein [Ricinus communis]|eukprot:XP_002525200.1 WRKY transcription factor 44 [Ricinus communis]